MAQATAGTPAKKPDLSRKTISAIARKKRIAKLKDPAAAKTYFEAKSTRANAKKAAYRKKKRGKK